ncbi:MAG TPA: SOS response-associated peptidase family protein [Chitinophagaceae bacterium]|nr:SOS response-associated peptidase family protein [Chitinophagaceae bacterium]
MCLDITYYSDLEPLHDYFPGLVADPDVTGFDPEAGAHIFAIGHKKYPVVIMDDEGRYHLKNFEWGIIADYMDTQEKIYMLRRNMVNARSEKILDDKRSFWYRIRKNRCLIPVMGIYEHREIKGWKNKVPYLVQLKDRPLFCIPGLYFYNNRMPSDPETGEMRGMFAMVTRWGNEVMRNIHNSGDNAYRMPLFLPKQTELEWLKPGLRDDEMKNILAYETPSDSLQYHTVYSIRGKTPRKDGRNKYESYEFANLPPLGNDDGTLQQALF